MADSATKSAILNDIQTLNDDLPNIVWGKFYINVDKYFKDTINGASIQELRDAFSDLDNFDYNKKIDKDPRDGPYIGFAIGSPKLYYLKIKNNRFKKTYSINITIDSTHDNKAVYIDSRLINRNILP